MQIECKNCGKVINVASTITQFICSCSNYIETPSSLRKKLCNECKYRIPKGCVLYLKPCTVKSLWADQISPPQKCPQKEKFNE
jgi:hypothetical protein